MEVIKYQEDFFGPLFSFWKKLAEKVPYFFSVSPEKWRECLLDDKLGDQKFFLTQEIFIAKEKDQVVGFSQCVQPAFAWDQKGEKYSNPPIGVIRHLFFDEDRPEAADVLFAKSENYLKQFPNQHAFYHIYGMSCNAHHGKLHQALGHVDRFLREKGYQVEHENVYYSLDLTTRQRSLQHELELVPQPIIERDIQNYEVCLQNQSIGMIQLRSLEELTGGWTSDIVYLTWMEIKQNFRRQGWGTKALQALIVELQSKDYRQIHLDTASTNQTAQQFYERFGFQNRGKTRCYVKATNR